MSTTELARLNSRICAMPKDTLMSLIRRAAIEERSKRYNAAIPNILRLALARLAWLTGDSAEFRLFLISINSPTAA